tara:strand:+ start:2480 stop:2737 length:258 start_codon:yes stop_codon:yes gene_type:complete
MVGEFFVLLMFFGEPTTLKEFTIRDSVSECLSAKRSIERTLRGGRSKSYSGSVRLACKKLEVEHDAEYNIIRFVTDLDTVLGPQR